MTFYKLLGSIGPAIVLNGCIAHAPTSRYTGNYSTTTGLHLWQGTGSGTYMGHQDYDVLHFKPSPRFCADTFKLPKKSRGAGLLNGLPLPPGIVEINSNTILGIDEAEIPNQEWQQYQFHQEKAGIAHNSLVPRVDAFPVQDYYTNPFYRYFPVVGISYEQANAFCRWRSQRVNATLNTALGHPDTLSPDYIRFEYRLPSESEWEWAAAVLSGLPYGTACASLPLQVNPNAAAYLKQRSGTITDVAIIKSDINAFNTLKPIYSIINYQQPQPYFLHLNTPGWVYQDPPNYWGLYQMLGNVAEMVQEPGITKGGSFRDPLEACAIKARGSYTGPAPTVGFRCVCVVTYPNRK